VDAHKPRPIVAARCTLPVGSAHLRRRHVVAIAFALALLASPAAADQRLSFADTAVGALPKDFVTALTGQGKPGDWKVVEDASAEGGRALAQLNADPTDYRFPLAIHEQISPSDVEVTTRFKAISGKEDQAGGIALRLIDRNNYYLARANALEDNVHFFRVVGGRRQELAGANIKVASGVWHTLTLRAEGNRLSVSLNGKRLFTHTDQTFNAPGKIALWTKADSVTRFDWIDIKPLKEK
jgi:hypothetical protein